MNHTLPASFIEGTCPPSEDRARTRGAFAREKHFLFQEEILRSQRKLMREAGLELCLFIKAESAGSGIDGRTRILPPRAASLRDRHVGGTGWNLSKLAGATPGSSVSSGPRALNSV